MTILARRFEQGLHGGIDFGSSQQRFRRLRGLHGTVWMDEYRGEKDHTRSTEQEHDNSAFQIAS
jgi:hypothetical protein